MGGGLFKVGGQLGQSDSGHALQPGTLLDRTGGHPASGARKIGNSVSLSFAREEAQKINAQGNIGAG